MDPKRTILIVDDAAMFRELEALFLARSGRVITAAGGREGLEAARREKPDLVLADLHMPDMDGEALCRAIKADPELGGTPVVVLTSSELAADRARALRAGADDVLPKPISRLALIDAVQRFLRSSGARGMPRVPFREPVRIRRRDDETWGVGENLSRGGMFVESSDPPAPRTEIALDFELPEVDQRVASTAQVVWHRPGSESCSAGMGLRFLALDATSARLLDDYVHERHPVQKPRGRMQRAS